MQIITDMLGWGIWSSIWLFVGIVIVTIILNIAVYRMGKYSNCTVERFLCGFIDTCIVIYAVRMWVL
jgi:hypothetical protein